MCVCMYVCVYIYIYLYLFICTCVCLGFITKDSTTLQARQQVFTAAAHIKALSGVYQGSHIGVV